MAAAQELKVGARCTIAGLVARADLNGRTAVISSFDDASGRFHVVFDKTPSSAVAQPSVAVRPVNLVLRQSCARQSCASAAAAMVAAAPSPPPAASPAATVAAPAADPWAPPPTYAAPMAPSLTVRRAWRSFRGIYDGDTDDEDEFVADAKQNGKQNAKQNGKRAKVVGRGGKHPQQAFYDADVTLLPRAGPTITVVATSDLHRHHEERYIASDTLSLAEWFDSSLSPSHVDVALFAGDLGLEMACESTSRAQTAAADADSQILLSWRRLLGRILQSKPNMRVVLVGGNHDGLLCCDDACLCCTYNRRCGGDSAGIHTPSQATSANLGVMLNGLAGADRVHLLSGDEAVDVVCKGGGVVRIVGSPWTNYDTQGKEHLSISHHWRPEGGFIFGGLGIRKSHMDCGEWWRRHWCRVGELLSADRTPAGDAIAAHVLVTHAPPHGVMDIVGGTKDNPSGIRSKRVGDEAMREMLESLPRPPLLHCFGHVHALQRSDEPPEGPRLAASKRVPSCLFANVAAERQLPEITGYRLSTRGAASRLDSGETFALPPPGAAGAASTSLVEWMAPLSADEWKRSKPEAGRLLMRPPTVLTLPLAGFACDCAAWKGQWEVRGAAA